MKPSLRCAIYARTASDRDECPNNASQQLDQVRVYAHQKGFEIIEECYDAGKSGRYAVFPPNLMKVMDLVTDEKIDAIILRDESRLYRGMEVYDIISWLERYNVKVITMQDELLTDKVNNPFSAIQR